MKAVVTIKPTAYKVAALRRAGLYDKQLDARKERISELARQLNEGYKFMISK